MRYIYLLLFCCCTGAARAQILSSCAASPALLHAYDNDVKDIAVQRMYDFKSADTMAIEVPQAWQDTIFNALAAVCNLGPQLEADSVFRSYCVHGWPGVNPYRQPNIIAKVDTSFAWAKQWFLGATVTGYTALDQFMSRHGVYLKSYFCLSGASSYLNNRATLATTRAINLKAFSDSLMKFPGIMYYDKGGIVGDGDHILYTTDTAAHFVFVAGWGDCPSGCTSYKSWKYTVSPGTCMVRAEAITTGGFSEPHTLPNCNLRALAVAESKPFTAISIYPNPVTDEIHLSNLSSPMRYSIYDATGHAAQNGMSAEGKINVVQLPTGLYFISLDDERNGARVVKRFLKQQ